MADESVLFNTEGAVGVLTLNRPDALNALNGPLLEGMIQAIREAKDNPSIRALVVTGAGRGFCAGADLVEFANRNPDESVGEAVERTMRTRTDPLILELDAMPKPVICAVNGVVAGGGVGVALAGDIVVAAESAKFIQVFTPQLAIIPDMGSTWYLTHLLGRARARGLALTGEPLPAKKAEEWGLIWKCVPDERLMDETMALAARLAGQSTTAMQAAMQALDVAERHSLSEQLDHERNVQRYMIDRKAFGEGVQAFLEKRKPDFSRD